MHTDIPQAIDVPSPPPIRRLEHVHETGYHRRRTPLRDGAARDKGDKWPIIREHLDSPREEALDHERDNGLVAMVRSLCRVIYHCHSQSWRDLHGFDLP